MNKNKTIGQLLTNAYDLLKNSGIDTYVLDAQLLMAKVLNKDKLFVLINKNLYVTLEVEEKYKELILQRSRKMPVKYILGECEFMGIKLFVKEGVLIPRPDTEILVDEVVKEIEDKQYQYICDLCSGSGAIGLSIASVLTLTHVECYDISSNAEEVSKVNIQSLGLESRVQFFHSNLLEEAIKANKVFDVIVSNPPYIREDVIPTLMEDVRNYEPYIALSGGKDGLEFYREITCQSIKCLKHGGMLAFEIGYDQRSSVEDILRSYGFYSIRGVKDLSGNDRVVLGFKP
jgi:release factor glutamine methyltransferase